MSTLFTKCNQKLLYLEETGIKKKIYGGQFDTTVAETGYANEQLTRIQDSYLALKKACTRRYVNRRVTLRSMIATYWFIIH